MKLSAHAHVDEHRAFGTEKLLAQGEQDVIPGAEGISTRHGRRAALMIGGSSQFMGAARLETMGSQELWSAGELAATWPAICREYHAPEARE
jgi:hypothetical protein